MKCHTIHCVLAFLCCSASLCTAQDRAAAVLELEALGQQIQERRRAKAVSHATRQLRRGEHRVSPRINSLLGRLRCAMLYSWHGR